MEGYVKIFRSLIDWEWWEDNTILRLWLTILLLVNHQESKWQEIAIMPGEMITSIDKLCQKSNLTQKQVRRGLNVLKRANQIDVETTNKFTKINVIKWADFQDNTIDDGKQKSTQEGNQRANKGQTKGKQRATNKNDKNEKKESNYINIITKERKDEIEIPKRPDPFKEAIEAYEEMRKRIKKPLTERAKDMLMKRLDKLTYGSVPSQIEMLNVATINCWQNVYPLRPDKEYKQLREDTMPDYSKEPANSAHASQEEIEEFIKWQNGDSDTIFRSGVSDER